MDNILEETAELFGLRKTVKPDGSFFWRENKDKLEVGFREAFYQSDIEVIRKVLGFGSMILNLGDVDFTVGALQTGNYTKNIWLRDGRKIDISLSRNGGVIASVSNEPDKNKPSPAFMDRRVQAPSGKRKCLHPLCDVEVDLSKKKSGCCSKAHMNFECRHPKCVERAKINGWTKATHPFGTKIAREHWESRARENV